MSSSDVAPAGSRAATLMERIPAVLLLLVAIACVQAGGALAVRLFHDLGPVGTAAIRVTVAAVVLLAAWRPQIRNRDRRDLVLAVAFGLSIAGMNLSIYEAMARIPQGVAVTIEFIGPLGIAIAMSRRGRDFLWAGLAAVGVALLTPLTGDRLDLPGVLCALLAAVCWAAYTLLGAAVGRRMPGGSGLALGLTSASIVLAPAGIAVAGAALVQRPLLIAMGACVALLSTIIPFSLEFEALRRLPARTYGVLVSLDPAAAAVSGALLLGQAVTLRTLAAIACVVVAAIGVTAAGGRDRRNK
jgi:inner membrane transporter RhtA